MYGGLLRGPVILENEYGNFYFYSQHLVQAMCEIFGFFPNSVKAYVNGGVITCVVRYNEYDVNIVFADDDSAFYAGINCEKYGVFSEYTLDGCFKEEFESFYKLLKGEQQAETYEEFISPVLILNAIDRSMKNSEEEFITRQ